MGEQESEVRAGGDAVGRHLVGALAWLAVAGSWLWAAIISDGIAGPYFFLHLSAVCLCMAAAAHSWMSFRGQALKASRRHRRP